MNIAKCPKCDSVVEKLKIEPIECEAPPEKQSNTGVSYLCPHCNSILGLDINPPSLQEQALGSE